MGFRCYIAPDSMLQAISRVGQMFMGARTARFSWKPTQIADFQHWHPLILLLDYRDVRWTLFFRSHSDVIFVAWFDVSVRMGKRIPTLRHDVRSSAFFALSHQVDDYHPSNIHQKISSIGERPERTSPWTTNENLLAAFGHSAPVCLLSVYLDCLSSRLPTVHYQSMHLYLQATIACGDCITPRLFRWWRHPMTVA